MTTADTRNKWIESHGRLTEEAEAFRDSQSVAFGLLGVYDELPSGEKVDVHEILAEWLISDDNKLRYDAEFVTSERQIVEMVPAIEKAIERLDKLSGPEAMYEVKALRETLNELGG